MTDKSSAEKRIHIAVRLPQALLDAVKNRAKALKVLRSRLYDLEMQKQQDAIAKERRGHVGSGDRSE